MASSIRSFRSAVLGLAALGLLVSGTPSAAETVAVPADSGLYVLHEDGLERIDGDDDFAEATWDSRASLAPDARFLIFDEGVAMTLAAAEHVSLREVVWVRAHYLADGTLDPMDSEGWGVTDLALFEVPMTLHTVDGRRDAVTATPQRMLAPGLYSLRYGEVTTLVAVDWAILDHEVYAAGHCVELHETAGERLFVECGRIDAYGAAALAEAQ